MVISNMPKIFQIVPRAISDQIYADNFMKIHSPVFVVMLLQGAILDKIPVSMGYNIHVASPPPPPKVPVSCPTFSEYFKKIRSLVFP